jgi:hypothetical protein
MPHRSVRKRLLLYLDNGRIFDKLSCGGVVAVTDDPFCRDGLNVVFFPWISLADKLVEGNDRA